MISPEQNANMGPCIDVTAAGKPDEECTRRSCLSRLNCIRHPESRELVRCPYQEGQ